MKRPFFDEAECEISDVKRRRPRESNANVFFSNLDSVVKSRLVAYLHFGAWVLFPLGVEVWVDSDLAFSRPFFDQDGAELRNFRRVAQFLRWLPRLRKVRRLMVQDAISHVRELSLRHLLTTEVRRYVSLHDLSEITLRLVTALSSPPCFVQGLVASQDSGRDSTYTVLTTSAAIPKPFFYLHFERVTAAWGGRASAMGHWPQHHLESFIFFHDMSAQDPVALRRLLGMRGRASSILDDADDLRGTSLYVELQLSAGFRSILLCLNGSDGLELASGRVRDALPPSGDWFFVLTINSSPNDSWQVRLEV